MICAARCKFNDAYKGPHGNISASYSDRVEINVLCRDFFCSNTDHDLIELSQIDSGLAFDLAQFCGNRSQHRLVGRKDRWDRIIEKPSGIERRDAQMRSNTFLDSEANEANRWAVFEVKAIEIGGPLEPGKTVPGKVRGTLTIRGKPVETVADSTVYYLRLTPEQVESQKRFGFTAESLRVNAKFATTFTNHGMQVPQLLILKVSNDILLEADLVLVLAP